MRRSRYAFAPTSSSQIDLVVTRHPALIELLRERGLVQGDVPIMSHATVEDVRGKHVAGILPLSLASQAASVTEIELRLTPQDRASGELSLERMREIAGPTVTYHCVRRNPRAKNPRNPRNDGSTYIITGRFETVTVSHPATMLEVAKRVSQNNTLPITIRQIFSDGSGKWIVAPAGCSTAIIKPPGPPIAQPEPEPTPLPEEPEEEPEDEPVLIRSGWKRALTLVEWYHKRLQDGRYDGQVWYWLIHNHDISEESAARQVDYNHDQIDAMEARGVDPWDVAKQLARLSYGQRIRPRRKRRPTWECPMPQTLLVAGIDVIAETKRLITVVPELQTAPMPSIYVRRNTTLRSRHGSAILARNHIRLTDAPELDHFEVIDTLSHELAHLNVFRLYKEKGHSQVWRTTFEHIALHGYGVQIKVSSRHSGELAEALRGRRGPARECSGCT